MEDRDKMRIIELEFIWLITLIELLIKIIINMIGELKKFIIINIGIIFCHVINRIRLSLERLKIIMINHIWNGIAAILMSIDVLMIRLIL